MGNLVEKIRAAAEARRLEREADNRRLLAGPQPPAILPPPGYQHAGYDPGRDEGGRVVVVGVEPSAWDESQRGSWRRRPEPPAGGWGSGGGLLSPLPVHIATAGPSKFDLARGGTLAEVAAEFDQAIADAGIVSPEPTSPAALCQKPNRHGEPCLGGCWWEDARRVLRCWYCNPAPGRSAVVRKLFVITLPTGQLGWEVLKH